MAKKTRNQPEIICLSDDDDEKSDDSRWTWPNTVKTVEHEEEKTRQQTEWIVHRRDIVRIPDLTIKRNDLLKKPFEIRGSKVFFGLVEFKIESETIFLKETEFELKLKSSSLENLTIRIAYSDITSMSFSFQSTPPVGFLQVRPEFGELFEKYIPSSDDQGKKFDPNGKDERRRRILFIFNSLNEETESSTISSIYYFLKGKCPSMNICCITSTRAEELYNSSRLDENSTTKFLSTPFNVELNQLNCRTVGLNKNQIRFQLGPDDLKCLNEGEFLNDNIIDFYLQYIYHEKLSDEDRKRTYLFNSFFYTRLTRRTNDDLPNISASERRYVRVKRWLRDVDIFSKDFLIVPINQTAHWFIVLIQHHNRVQTEADLISDDDDNHNFRKLNKKKKISKKENSETEEKEIDSASSTSDSIRSTDSTEEKPKNLSEIPSIIIFDSLRSGGKSRVAATLREFLQLEFDHKKTLPGDSLQRKVFNIETISAIDAAVPQQPNYFDCGLYILQYIESFFAHRSSKIDFRSPTTFANWCETKTMGSSKRKQIFDVINQQTII